MEFIQWLSSTFQNVVERIGSCFSNYFDEKPLVFTDVELSEYMALTHLTKEEILRAYANFCSMQPQFFSESKNPYLPAAKVMDMPEFKVNPFKDRMMKVFSSYEEYMTFEDYLDMMSVFSENAPLDLKAEYAFRMYDFDEDDMLSIEDLLHIIKRINEGQKMEEKDMREAAIQALLDGDIDEDGYLAFTEFLYLLGRIEDFKSSFSIRL